MRVLRGISGHISYANTGFTSMIMSNYRSLDKFQELLVKH